MRRAGERRRRRSRWRPLCYGLLLFVLAAACGVPALALALDWMLCPWEFDELLGRALFSAVLAAAAAALSLRYMSGEKGYRSLAWRCLKEIPNSRTRPSREGVLGAVERAVDLCRGEFEVRAGRLRLLAQVILLVGALGTALGIIDSFSIIGDYSAAHFYDEGAVAYAHFAVALVAFVTLKACRCILSSIAARRVAEVRAIARVLLEHAVDRASARARANG